MQSASTLHSFDERIAHLRQACEDSPAAGEIRLQLAQALGLAGRYRQATETYFDALEAGFQHPLLFAGLAWALLYEGRPHEAVIACRAALAQGASAHDPGCLVAWSNLFFGLLCVEDTDLNEIAEEYRKFGQLFPAPQIEFGERRAGRIRVGFLCAWFTFHPAGRFSLPVIAGLNRSRFEVFCYDSGAHESPLAHQIEFASDHWRDISKLGDDAALEAIREDDLDLLIDLDGHTGNHRLAVLAPRAARTQVNWFGFPNTTGVPAVDYRIIDSTSDPEPFVDSLHTEKLVRISPPFFPFPAPDPSPAVNELPALANGHITFGLFNHVHKYSPPFVQAVASVLRATPSSRLVIRSTACFDSDVQRATIQRFVARGVAAERIDCDGARGHFEFLRAHNDIDIMFDPFPYTGCTTTCESLWMGVPLITLAGRVHHERVSTSLLIAAGLPEMIAHTQDEYVEKLLQLAGDVDRLACLREKLRDQLRESPVMALDGFVQRFESALLNILSARD